MPGTAARSACSSPPGRRCRRTHRPGHLDTHDRGEQDAARGQRSRSLRGLAADPDLERAAPRVPRGPPGRRIALTFDDGPDPRWTPRIAALLRDSRAGHLLRRRQPRRRATRRSSARSARRRVRDRRPHLHPRRPERARAGSATSSLASPRARIAGAAGVGAALMRPPYSATPAAVTAGQSALAQRRRPRGYLIVALRLRRRGLAQPGRGGDRAQRHAAGATGGMVLLHDGGGDRSQTMAALERAGPAAPRARLPLRPPLGDGRHDPRAGRAPTASRSEHMRGRCCSCDARGGSLDHDVGACPAARARRGSARSPAWPRLVVVRAPPRPPASAAARAEPDFTPPGLDLVPAYNEAAGIERAVRSLAASDYPDVRGRRRRRRLDDGTGELVERLELERRAGRPPAEPGKPAALNRGIAAARTTSS